MNKKQRLRNRATAAELHRKVRHATPCPECGEPTEGGHWITTRQVTLEDEIIAANTGVPLNPDDFGFWVCDKFYGEDGRRMAEFINPQHTADGRMAQASAFLMALLGESGQTEPTVVPVPKDGQPVEQTEAFKKAISAPLPGLLSVADDVLEARQEHLAEQSRKDYPEAALEDLIGNTDADSIARAPKTVYATNPGSERSSFFRSKFEERLRSQKTDEQKETPLEWLKSLKNEDREYQNNWIDPELVRQAIDPDLKDGHVKITSSQPGGPVSYVRMEDDGTLSLVPKEEATHTGYTLGHPEEVLNAAPVVVPPAKPLEIPEGEQVMLRGLDVAGPALAGRFNPLGRSRRTLGSGKLSNVLALAALAALAVPPAAVAATPKIPTRPGKKRWE